MILPPPPGRLVPVAGTRLHVREQGAGPPVVLEAGAGEWSSHWGEVLPRLAESFRVIAYDRAGLGWSEAGKPPRDAGHLAGELEALLDALEVREPAIFVGHSLGAGIVRLLAGRSPDRVAGLVFVDGWNEAMAEWERQRGVSPETPRWMLTAELWAARLGLLRLATVVWPVPPPPWPMSHPEWHDVVALGSSARFVKACLDELEAIPESDRQIFAVTRVEAPVRVLVAAEMMRKDDAPRGYPIDEHNRAWVDSALALVALSNDAQLTVVGDTDHMIPLRRPDVVVAAALDLARRA